MKRFLVRWAARRAHRLVLFEMDWIRQTMVSDQARLTLLEDWERKLQGRVVAAESARSLLKPFRSATGFFS